jgi:dTMP kinase
MHRLRGKLITFEGIEGSGKSTHAKLLAEKMRGAGYKILLVREPGGTLLGEAIRLLLSRKEDKEKMCAEAELFLFMASRAQLVESVVLPALRRGVIVICDRFMDSTAAYQGYARGCDLNLVNKMNVFAVHNVVPDLTILLDLQPRAGFKRLVWRNRRRGLSKDRIESENMAFHNRVRRGYLEMARRRPRRYRVINVTRPVSKVHADVWKAVSSLLRNFR